LSFQADITPLSALKPDEPRPTRIEGEPRKAVVRALLSPDLTIPCEPVNRPSAAPTGDTDEQYSKNGRWEELIELCLARLESASEPAEKVDIFRRIARVFEEELGDAAQAFDALIEAFRLDPCDPAIGADLERLASSQRRWEELDAAKEQARVASGKEEPAALTRAALQRATELGALGASEGQRDALGRALTAAKTDADKLEIHLALAELHDTQFHDRAAAMNHYQGALAVDPHAIGALRGLERLLREEERFADLGVVLERQVAAARTSEDQLPPLMRLAELLEVHFVKPQQAAAKLERILEIDPTRLDALDCLERCYLAVRAWPELARAMGRRAELAQTKAERVHVLLRVAEVLETKVLDLDGAVEHCRRAALTDPRDTRPLLELARLTERAGDWVTAASYREQLVDLLVDAHAQARMHLAIGELLRSPERNPTRAREHFERALVVEPANVSAWEALQTIAEGSADESGRLFCLEQRAVYTEVPRHKAQLFIELGAARRAREDRQGALGAYETALRADPNNEIAAAEVLSAYAEAERWAEAAPLSDLLVSRAMRDRDVGRAYDLLKLTTRIASALNDDERALLAARAALSLRRSDPEARQTLLTVAHRLCKEPGQLAQASDSLDAIAADAADLPPGALLALGDIQRARGKDESAALVYESILALDGSSAGALRGLADVYVARGDWVKACETKERLAAQDEPQRFGLLVESAELWLQRAKDVGRAAAAFEQALALRPRDHRLLHTMVSLYGQLENWAQVAATLRAIADAEEDPSRKAKSVYAMAQVVRDKLEDPVKAASLFEEVLELDPKRLDAFERIVRIFTASKDWRALEAAYKRMLRRARTSDRSELVHALYHQLGLLYRDRVGNAEAALTAFSRARALKPADEQGLRIVTELYIITDQVDKAIDETLAFAEKDPFARGPYRELYGLFLRRGSVDRAWCACDVLAHLGQIEGTPDSPYLTVEQARYLSDYPPYVLADIRGALSPTGWVTRLTHQDLDPTLTTILGLITPAVIRTRTAVLTPAKLEALLGETLGQARSAFEHAAVSALEGASQVLGHPPPAFKRKSGPVPITVGLSPWPTLILSPQAIEALSPRTLAFLAGKRLAEQRPALLPRALFPSVSDLSVILQTAIRIAQTEPSQASNTLDGSLLKATSAEELAMLRDAVATLLHRDASPNLQRWSQLADVTASRAGLLLAGSVSIARKALALETWSASDLTPREHMGQLLLFAVSKDYADLRGAIGVSVESRCATAERHPTRAEAQQRAATAVRA
jgi:tetratricopeptide (TPR) repeat protein